MPKQVEQLYFTWSSTGYGDIPGFRLRAASRGVADINSARYKALIPFLNYYLPTGTDAYEATTEASPHCLVYAKVGEDYILAQKVYTGKDTHGRPGAYFIHMLVGLPADFVAQDAMQLWRSNFWKYWKVVDDQAQGVSLDLPTIPRSELPGERDAQNTPVKSLPLEMKSFLSEITQAYSTLKAEQKLYIAGTPDQVADLIWVLTHSLPRSMQRDLTFSTYELEVLKASVDIVGTCNPQTALLKGYTRQPVSFPAECYSRGLVVDCEKRQVLIRERPSPEAIEYAMYTTEGLLQRNKTKELVEFLQGATQEGINTFPSLLFHFTSEDKFNGRKPLTCNDVLECFRISRYAKHLSKEIVRRKLIDCALTNHQWWNDQARSTIQARDHNNDAIQISVRGVTLWLVEQICTTNVQRHSENWTFLFAMLQDIMPPNEDNTPWQKLFNDPRAQYALISLASVSSSWWQEQALPLIQEFSQTGNEALTALRAFGQQIATELFQTLVKLELKQWPLLHDMLGAVTPPTRDNVPWVQFLEHFKAYMDKHKSFHPTTFPWSIRFPLLTHCAMCYRTYEREKEPEASEDQHRLPGNQPVRERLIASWLQLANWNEFEALGNVIDQEKQHQMKDNNNHETFPHGWYQLAFIDLLLRSGETSLPKPNWFATLFQPEAHYSILMGALMHMMESPKQQPTVLLCFHKLAESRYKYIQEVLFKLISTYALSDELEEQFFVAAGLNPQQKAKLLEEHLLELLPPPNAHTQARPKIVTLIREYLEKLTLDRLRGVELPTICKTLRLLYDQQATLPVEVNNQVKYWICICHTIPITHPFFQSEKFSFEIDSVSLKSLNAAIIGVNLSNDQNFKEYKEELFFLFVNGIRETDTLRKVLESFYPALTGKKDWTDLLRELTIYFGKNYDAEVPYELFVPYMEMALFLYKKQKQKSDKDSKNIWNLYLEPLLKRVDSKTFALIDRAISSGSYPQEWIVFVNRYKPRRKQRLFTIPGKTIKRVKGSGILSATFHRQKTVQAPPSPQQPQPQSIPPGQSDPGSEVRDQQLDQIRHGGTPNQQDNSPLTASGQQPPMQEGNSHDTNLNGGVNSDLNVNAQSFPYNPQKPQEDNVQQHQPNLQRRVTNAPPTPSRPLTNSGGFSHYSSEQASPASIVNGSYRISQERVQMVYALKDLYIPLRLVELNQEKMNNQGQDATWIDDEQHELRECRTQEDILRLLENDGLILRALKGFRERGENSAELDPLKHLDFVFQQVSQYSGYVRTLGSYSDTEMQQVLLVFLRYRALSYFLRQQGTISMSEWLERQRAQGHIQRQ